MSTPLPVGRSDEADLPCTLVTTCKPFRGITATLQRNAFESWARLEPAGEVLVFGDEEGVASISRELGFRHVPEIDRSEEGTPLLDSLLREADRLASASTLVLVNADIILTPELPAVLRALVCAAPRSLGIARRWNVDLDRPWDFSDPDWAARLVALARGRGSLEPAYGGIDLFVYPRGLLCGLPPYVFGRGRWDSGILLEARTLGVPVVDLTEALPIVHPNHDYAHIAGSPREVYDGPELRRNRALLGGDACILTPLNATHRLCGTRLRRNLDLRPWHVVRRMATWPALYPPLRPLAPLVTRLAPLWRRGFGRKRGGSS